MMNVEHINRIEEILASFKSRHNSFLSQCGAMQDVLRVPVPAWVPPQHLMSSFMIQRSHYRHQIELRLQEQGHSSCINDVLRIESLLKERTLFVMEEMPRLLGLRHPTDTASMMDVYQAIHEHLVCDEEPYFNLFKDSWIQVVRHYVQFQGREEGKITLSGLLLSINTMKNIIQEADELDDSLNHHKAPHSKIKGFA